MRKKAFEDRRHKQKKECGACKKNNRTYQNHEEKDCLYQTVWKGKSGEDLKRSQKEYFDKKKNKHTSKVAKIAFDVPSTDEESDSSSWESDTEDEGDENPTMYYTPFPMHDNLHKYHKDPLQNP